MNIDNQRIKKSLGQNFIIDENYLSKLEKKIITDKEDNLIEIGPGKGALTKYLVKKKFKKLYLIEKDNNLAKNLKQYFQSDKRIEVINDDALNINYNKFNKNTIILGNLPFNISSQLLIKWLEYSWPPFYKKMILMFQKELGERIVSPHNNKKYGRISVLAQTRCIIKKFADAPSNIFFPKPKVDGLILEFIPIINNKKINFKNLQVLLKKMFQHRRKKIKSILKNESDILKALNIDENLRPENLSIDDYYKITSRIKI